MIFRFECTVVLKISNLSFSAYPQHLLLYPLYMEKHHRLDVVDSECN